MKLETKTKAKATAGSSLPLGALTWNTLTQDSGRNEVKRCSGHTTQHWCANEVPRTPTYMMSGWINRKLAGEWLKLPGNKPYSSGEAGVSCLSGPFLLLLSCHPQNTHAVPGMLHTFFNLHSAHGRYHHHPHSHTAEEAEVWKVGWQATRTHTEGLPIPSGHSLISLLPWLGLGLWPCIRPKALAVLRFFHIPRDLWHSLCRTSSPQWFIILTWGWNKWTSYSQEVKCLKNLDCSDTSPNGSPMLSILFEVRSASTSNGINFPFNNSSYKPQT